MRKPIFLAYMAIMLSVFSGCSVKMKQPDPQLIEVQHISEKNYVLGTSQTVYVGQPLVKVKDYQVDCFKSNSLQANADFIISGGSISLVGARNQKFPIRGTVVRGGKVYSVIDIPSSRQGGAYSALVDEDGAVSKTVLNGDVSMIYMFKASPESVRFIPAVDEKINNDAEYLNYELVYSGTNGSTIGLIYREYTSGDMARPAFHQQLMYENAQKQVRFRNIVLRIDEATNEKITYTVLSDT